MHRPRRHSSRGGCMPGTALSAAQGMHPTTHGTHPLNAAVVRAGIHATAEASTSVRPSSPTHDVARVVDPRLGWHVGDAHLEGALVVGPFDGRLAGQPWGDGVADGVGARAHGGELP